MMNNLKIFYFFLVKLDFYKFKQSQYIYKLLQFPFFLKISPDNTLHNKIF